MCAVGEEEDGEKNGEGKNLGATCVGVGGKKKGDGRADHLCVGVGVG